MEEKRNGTSKYLTKKVFWMLKCQIFNIVCIFWEELTSFTSRVGYGIPKKFLLKLRVGAEHKIWKRFSLPISIPVDQGLVPWAGTEAINKGLVARAGTAVVYKYLVSNTGATII